MTSEVAPTWQVRARERSLASARERADAQVTRILHAAQDIINEETDFTVPLLVSRAGMSTKTFYRHFASRDELLLAVLEEELAIGAHLMRKAIDEHTNPLERLKACVLAHVALPGRYRNTNVCRARIAEAQRLRALYPYRFYEANEPIIAEFQNTIENAAAAGLIVVDDSALAARSLFHVSTGHIIDTAFTTDGDSNGSSKAYSSTAEYVWRFCCVGLQLSEGAEAIPGNLHSGRRAASRPSADKKQATKSRIR
jgi:AcrR family transcriptional regulator